MNKPCEKQAKSPEVKPKRPPGGDEKDSGPRPKSRKPPNVDDLVIRQIHDWQMDTEVQAFIHKAEKRGGEMGN